MENLSDDRGYQLYAITAGFLIVVWVLVTLRCSVRLFILKDFQLDDYIIVVALLSFTVMASFFLVSLNYGLGRHGDTLDIMDEINAIKYMALATIVYIATTALVKTAIAIFLLRIAVQKRYIWIIRISIIIVNIWTVAIFFFNIFQCTPVEYQWDPRPSASATCVSGANYVSSAYSFSVLTIISDWLYALIPIPMIWHVKMNMQTKCSVLGVLSLGIFASVATLARCFYLAKLADNGDVLYTTMDTLIWTVAEPGLGITAAAVVTLRPLLRTLKVPGFLSKSESKTSEVGSSHHRFHLSHVHEMGDREGSMSQINSGLRMHSNLDVGSTWTLPSNARLTGDDGFNPFGDNATADANKVNGQSFV